MPTKNTKKTNTRASAKRATRSMATPVTEVHECHCGCKCSPMKKFIVLFCMFLLGFAVAKIAFCPCHHRKPKMGDMRPVFVNGCMDTESIKCPKMQEKVMRMDLDGNGCITEQEFRSAKQAMHHKKHNRFED